jgi:hypothetical protein
VGKRKSKVQKPKPRSLYAFTKHRRGDFILFVEEKDDVYTFMQLPDRYKILLTLEEFTEGVTTKLLDFVEQIPEDVYEVAAANIKDLNT